MGAQGIFRRISDIVRKCLDERTVRRTKVLIVATQQNNGSHLKCGAGHFGGESGLADARLARDQDDFSSLTGRHPLEGVGQ